MGKEYPTRKKPSSHLTERETDVLKAIGEGLSAQEVADKLTMSKRTVDFHLGNIYGKLEVHNRVQACKRATELGLITW